MSLSNLTIEKWHVKWKKNGVVNHDGYCSTTLDRRSGISWAIRSEIPDDGSHKQVLLEIEIENEKQMYYFNLNDKAYTNYPDEQEILL